MDEGGAEIRVAGTISAQPGPQWQTGGYSDRVGGWQYSARYVAGVLGGLISLERRELLSVERLPTSLTRITGAYARQGYVDSTNMLLKLIQGFARPQGVDQHFARNARGRRKTGSPRRILTSLTITRVMAGRSCAWRSKPRPKRKILNHQCALW